MTNTTTSEPEFETLLVSRKGPVTTVTFNRPDKRNAMSPQLHLDMTAALEWLRYDEQTRVVVITGSGPAFCAGMDLKQFFISLRENPAEYDRVSRAALEWRGRTLRQFPKPTIAMINGFTFGGAFAIVEGCDIAIASSEAKFGLSEVNFGMFPGGAVSKALANLLRPRDALFYGLTGRPFDADTAASMGLINFVVPHERLTEEVDAIAQEIAKKNPEALTATKEAYHVSLNMPWDEAMAFSTAREALVTLRTSDEWRSEGIGDFLAGEYKPGLNNRNNG